MNTVTINLSLHAAQQGHIEHCISPVMLDELREVLARRKCELGAVRAAAIANLAAQTFTVVTRATSVRVIAEDPDDDMVLATTLTAAAPCVVSGDTHLLRPDTWRGIVVRTPRALVEFLVSGS